MKTELKPCPFCLGIASVVQQGSLRRSHVVECGDCGLRLEANEVGSNCNKTWNSRPEHAALQAELAESNRKLSALRELLRSVPVEAIEFGRWHISENEAGAVFRGDVAHAAKCHGHVAAINAFLTKLTQATDAHNAAPSGAKAGEGE